MNIKDIDRFFEMVANYRRKNPDNDLGNFVIGLQGEFVFKQLLDTLKIDYTWTEKGVPQPFDFIVNGSKIEIKTVTYNMNYPKGGRQDLLVIKSKAKADFYILIAESLKEGFYIAGYVSNDELLKSEVLKTSKGHSYRVVPERLWGISSLLNKLGA